ncbi:MAG: hypothetical protein AAF573_08455, partial [Bacteroidota bacterium]
VTYTLPTSQLGNVNSTITLTVVRNGCSTTNTQTFTVLDNPEATLSQSNPTCDASDGTITITFPDNPNRMGIMFSIDGGSTYPASVNDNTGSYTFSGLSSGSYAVWSRWGDGNCAVPIGNITLAALENITSVGTLSGAEERCGGYNPSQITGTASTGGTGASITYRWQRRTYNCGTSSWSGWSTISSSNSQNYDPGAITTTTEYRRQSRRNGCPWLTTNVIRKTVVENLTTNTIGSNQEYCDSGDPVALTGAAASGGCFSTVTYQWQYRNGTSGSWQNVSGVTGQNYDPPTLSSTRQYRRLARRGNCSWVPSNVITITIYTSPTATINGVSDICSGSSLSISAANQGGGSSYTWNFGANASPSTASGTGPHNVTYTLPTSQLGNMNSTITLTVVRNGCSTTNTQTFTVLDNPEATLSQSNPTCDASDGTITITFPDNPNRTGIMFSIDGGSTYPASVNDNTGSYTFSNLSSGSYVVWSRWGNSECAVPIGNITLAALENITSVGSISGAEERCGGYNPSQITGTASTGGTGASITYRWQRRTYNCGTSSWSGWSTISSSNSQNYDPGAITTTTEYRRQSRRNGCPWLTTNVIRKTVVENYADAGTIAGNQENCSAFDPVAFTNTTSPTGSCWGTIEYRWQRREGNHCNNSWGSWTVISGANSNTYDPPTVTISTQYRRQVRQLPCTDWRTSNQVEVLILDASPCAPIALPASLTTCDDANGTGFGTFYLHDANPVVQGSSTDVNITYHATSADANSGANPLISPYVSQNATVYVRVEKNTTGCFLTNTISLNVSGKCDENCNNGLDDDGDGLIDCDDPDCDCCKAKVPTISIRKK